MAYSKRVNWRNLHITQAVKDSYSASATLRLLGRVSNGGNAKRLCAIINELNINTDHWWGKPGYICGSERSKPLDQILTENSTYHRTKLKQRVIENKLLDYTCAECGLGPTWNGKPLVLQLDHINGVYNDNRLNNLRILCPNCHTQTATFVGKKYFTPKLCIDCKDEIDQRATRCVPCSRINCSGKK